MSQTVDESVEYFMEVKRDLHWSLSILLYYKQAQLLIYMGDLSFLPWFVCCCLDFCDSTLYAYMLACAFLHFNDSSAAGCSHY